MGRCISVVFANTFFVWRISLIAVISATCGPAPEVENAKLQDENKATYPAWSHVSYSCRSGYVSDGEKKLICINSQWSVINFKCREICRPPDPVKDGHIDIKGKLVGSVIYFSCHNGTLIGAANATCNKGGNWSNPSPTCHKNCVVSALSHGYFKSIDRVLATDLSVQHGVQIEAHCELNYSLSSAGSSVCIDGSWSPSREILCEAVRCGRPPISGLDYSVRSPSYAVGETVSASDGCSRSFCVGRRTLTCLPTGRWDGSARCSYCKTNSSIRFKKFKNMKIVKHNHKGLKANIDECEEMCARETSFDCLSFDFKHPNVCKLSMVAQYLLEKELFKFSKDTTYYEKICQVNCPDPGDIVNGTKVGGDIPSYSDSFAVGDEVSYACNDKLTNILENFKSYVRIRLYNNFK